VSWNFDIASAPRGKTVTQVRTVKDKQVEGEVFQPDYVILATKCGSVGRSQYLPREDRWEGLAKGEQPVAWQAWPEHPGVSA
jgi:hypothetical protein